MPDYEGLVHAFFVVAFVAALLALLPDPFAFNKKWSPTAAPTQHAFCGTWERPAWYHALRVRNWFTHWMSLAFVTFTVALIVWDRAAGKPAAESEVAIALLVCLGVSAVGAFFYHYTTGVVVAVAIGWLVTERLHATPSATITWAQHAGVAVAAVVVVAIVIYCATDYVLTHVVDFLQYPVSAGFTIAFAPPFYVDGWRHYIETAPGPDGQPPPHHHELWPPAVASFFVALVICVLQLLYHRSETLRRRLEFQPRGGRPHDQHGCLWRRRPKGAAAAPKYTLVADAAGPGAETARSPVDCYGPAPTPADPA